MTSLQIVPKWKDKSARFKGTVAAGEHVAVSIVNDNGEGGAYVASTEHLRLRVVGPDGRVLAQFPMPETSTDAEEVLPTSELEDEGEGEGETEGEGANTWDSDTTPLQCELNLNTVQMLKAVPPGSNVPLLFVLDDIDAKTLYFKEFCEVTHWPRRCGEDEPVDLDGYADFVANITEELASHAGNTNNPHGVTKAQIGLGNVDNTSDADKPISAAVAAALALKYAKPGTGIPKSDLADDVKTSLGKADTALQSHQDISGKADLQNGKVPASQLPSYVDDVLEYDSISEFPATGEEGKIYVDKATNRTYRWSGTQYTEIANPALDNAVTHNSANGVKSSGIWAAIWGALTALPTGFTSLYDWCVSQLAGKANASHTHGQSDVTGLTAALDGKASTADATLTPIYSQTPTFSEWTFSGTSPSSGHHWEVTWDLISQEYRLFDVPDGQTWENVVDSSEYTGPSEYVVNIDITLTTVVFPTTGVTATRTRTDIIGYTLGSQSDKPLQPKGDYALLAQLYAAVRNLAPDFTAKEYEPNDLCTYNGVIYLCQSAYTADAQSAKPDADTTHWEVKKVSELFLPLTGGRIDGELYLGADAFIFGEAGGGQMYDYNVPGNAKTATFTDIINTANGNSTAYAKPYDLGTPVVINAASSETVEGETVYYGAATLVDRAANIVQVTATLDELRITFPAATSGKVRDFGLRVEIGTGSAALTAPALVPPAGVTLENAVAEIPALADGTATAKGVTLLYFSETAPGVFLVKGEQVEEVQ